MATTTNFGWTTPDNTDLVKNGALAIRTLGSAIDTSLVDLKGGTTGQVLTKASGTDMDFSWASPGGGWTLLATKSLSGSSTNTISSISQDYNSLYLIVNGMSQSANGTVSIKLNGNSSLYAWTMIERANTTINTITSHDSSTIPFAGYNVSATSAINGTFLLHNYNSAYAKMFFSFGRGQDNSSLLDTLTVNGLDRNTAAITSISIISEHNTTAGTAYLYGI
jgi:hypothetical protein